MTPVEPGTTRARIAFVARILAVLATCGGVYLHLLAGYWDSGSVQLRPVGHMTIVSGAAWLLSLTVSAGALALDRRARIPYVTAALSLIGLGLLLSR